jgi:cytochrome bd-type quinol oxidase subunit 2
MSKKILLILSGATVLSLPNIYIQFLNGDPTNSVFSYPVVLTVNLVVLFTVIGLMLIREENTIENVKISRLILVSLVTFTAISSWTIWKLAVRYGQTDTQGFWEDGLLRELSGRLAPLMTIMILCLPAIAIVRNFYPRLSSVEVSWETNRFSLDTARRQASERWFSILSAVVLLVVSIAISGLFFP